MAENMNETMEEKLKTVKKKAIWDWVISGLLLVGLVVLYFFWGCKLDLWVTILAVVLLIAGTVMMQLQNKKLKEKYSVNE